MRTRYVVGFLMVSFFLISSQNLQAQNLVELKDLHPEQIKFAGFKLNQEQSIEIEAQSLRPRRHRDLPPYSNAWIINSENREVVWQLADAEDENKHYRKVSYKDNIKLEAGTYEVYYSTFPDWGYYEYDEIRGLGSLIRNVLHEIFDDDYDDDYYDRDTFRDLYISVKGDGNSLSKDDVLSYQEKKKKEALVSYTALRGEEFIEQGIVVEKPVEVHVYSMGEVRRDGQFDFGRIINLKTRQTVWELSYRNSENAGGARKNRLSDEVIRLDPGKYKILYVTDDSHHYRDWNSAPPYDPGYWGLTMWLDSESDKNNIKLVNLKESQEGNKVVDFRRVRDEDYLVKGFSTKKPLDFHIYALGEGRDGEMFDYGWIVNTKTHKRVWEMKHRITTSAGGDEKNRLFDGIVRLEPGNYMAYYITDDSHAYLSWNTQPPYDTKNWGMQIYVLDDNYEEGDIADYREEDDKSVLAKLVRMGDDDRARKQFSLAEDTRIHIYAIGEGSNGDMYDYAWIENAETGRTVWEMTYRKTDHAGGARKNRLIDDEILLEAGTYYIIYETDDSHSFEEWNSRPPYDPVNWGVTLHLTE